MKGHRSLIAAATGKALAVLATMTTDDLAASDAIVAEVVEMLCMTERPAVLDSTQTRQLLGIQATPFDDAVTAIVKTGGALTSH